VTVSGLSCRSATIPAPQPMERLEEARQELFGPLPGDMAALYRLRVRATGGLRLSVLTLADAGRVTISEQFGSALSLTAWQGQRMPVVFDLRERCRFTTNDLSGVLGVSNLPLPHAIRILAGRLPAVEGDRVEVREDGRLQVEGSTWSGLVSVMPDPWRVVSVEDVTEGEGIGWNVNLRDHTASIPGWLRVKGADGRWAELELVRLQWNTATELPQVPNIEPCGGTRRPLAIGDDGGSSGD
jgi:hypothetical protein